MAVIGPVWVDGSFFGSVYIMSGLDSGDFWVGSGGFRWFRVGSDGFGWFHVLSITMNLFHSKFCSNLTLNLLNSSTSKYS